MLETDVMKEIKRKAAAKREAGGGFQAGPRESNPFSAPGVGAGVAAGAVVGGGVLAGAFMIPVAAASEAGALAGRVSGVLSDSV